LEPGCFFEGVMSQNQSHVYAYPQCGIRSHGHPSEWRGLRLQLSFYKLMQIPNKATGREFRLSKQASLHSRYNRVFRSFSRDIIFFPISPKNHPARIYTCDDSYRTSYLWLLYRGPVPRAEWGPRCLRRHSPAPLKAVRARHPVTRSRWKALTRMLRLNPLPTQWRTPLHRRHRHRHRHQHLRPFQALPRHRYRKPLPLSS
jgi:hypothetical protein